MSWAEKVKGLEDKLREASAAFDGHDARLVFTAKLPSEDEDQRLLDLPAWEPLEHGPDATMLARLKLPVLDHGDVLVEVRIVGPEAVRSKFAELAGIAGTLIPENVVTNLDRFEPAAGRMTERGRFLAWLWELESTRLAKQGEPLWLDLGDGCSFVFGIREPFRLARLVLRCFRENPGGQNALPRDDGVEKWPADNGWHFREGQAAFRGLAFDIQGVPWRLLKKLTAKPGTPVGKAVLLDAINIDGGTGEEALRSHLSRTRDILRWAFAMSSDIEPLPNVERGMNAAWKLDEKVFPSVAEIQRSLNGR